MTPNDISLLAVAVSLLSVLFAERSLREAKEARSEIRKHKRLNRMTELSALLSDVLVIALQLRYLATECFSLANDKDLASRDDVAPRLKTLTDKTSAVNATIGKIKELKQKLNSDLTIDLQQIEEMFSAFYEKMKLLENDLETCRRDHEWLKGLPAPSVYEKRGVLSI